MCQECLDTERRSSDQVHMANMREQLAIKAFAHKVKSAVEPLLSEAFDVHDDANLTDSQRKMIARLVKIKEALERAGIEF